MRKKIYHTLRSHSSEPFRDRISRGMTSSSSPVGLEVRVDWEKPARTGREDVDVEGFMHHLAGEGLTGVTPLVTAGENDRQSQEGWLTIRMKQ